MAIRRANVAPIVQSVRMENMKPRQQAKQDAIFDLIVSKFLGFGGYLASTVIDNLILFAPLLCFLTEKHASNDFMRPQTELASVERGRNLMTILLIDRVL